MYENITVEEIKREMLDRIPSGIETREGSYTNILLSPAAYELWKFYQSLDALIPIAFVDETSGEYIDKRCAEYGITRKPGTKATAEVTFTGIDGISVPKGTVVSTATGLEFITVENTAISSGMATVVAEASEIGSLYNVAAGAINRMPALISGIESVQSSASAGGTDPESDEDLVQRYHDFLQKPASSGNKYHYEQWAKEVDGVGNAKVIPLWNGAGTVKVLLAGPDQKPVDGAVVSSCVAHIEEERPIGASVTVESAQELTINISAAISRDGSVTLDKIKDTFTKSAEEYLKDSVFTRYELLYNRFVFFLLGIDGVSDYITLTINGEMSNITVGEDEIPVLGTVVITDAP